VQFEDFLRHSAEGIRHKKKYRLNFETSTGIEIRNLWHGNIVRKWKLKTLEYENIQGISRCSQHSVVNFCRQKERVNFAIFETHEKNKHCLDKSLVTRRKLTEGMAEYFSRHVRDKKSDKRDARIST